MTINALLDTADMLLVDDAEHLLTSLDTAHLLTR